MFRSETFKIMNQIFESNYIKTRQALGPFFRLYDDIDTQTTTKFNKYNRKKYKKHFAQERLMIMYIKNINHLKNLV